MSRNQPVDYRAAAVTLLSILFDWLIPAGYDLRCVGGYLTQAAVLRLCASRLWKEQIIDSLGHAMQVQSLYTLRRLSLRRSMREEALFEVSKYILKAYTILNMF